jgi:microcystin degradation protein MlrC
MRIAIGGVSHETNTFAGGPTPLEAFSRDWQHGQTIIDEHRGVRGDFGGMLDAAERLGIEIVPTFAASTEPSGTIALAAYERLRDELISGLRAALPVDAVCLALHGAGVAEQHDDLEGALLAEVRQLIGPDMPLLVTLDLHGNITNEMVAHADILLGNHYYPHTDSYERGVEAVEIAARMVNDGLRPTGHITHLPMLIPTCPTSISPGTDANAICFDWEARPGMLDCTFYHGFAFTDIPGAGVSVVATAAGDPELARQASEDVARKLWEMREQFRAVVTTPEDAIRQALAFDGGPVVLADHSDNPGGGCPGDSTHLLRPLLEAAPPNTCFGYVVDPQVAEQAHAAGAGATIDIRLGGKTDQLHGTPIETSAYVKCLTDGRFTLTSPVATGYKVDLGKMARLVINGVDVLISSVRTQVLDAEVFLLHGIDVTRYKIVVVKSSTHFRAGFEPLAAKIIRVDTPGLTSVDLTSFPYQRLRRPLWPLDEGVSY